MTRFLAWDIEISKVLPEGTTDWQAHMPLGISCMATYAQDESGPKVWFGSGDDGPPPAMSKDDLVRFVAYLQAMVADGYNIVTWNGLSFDWHQLAVESGLHAECVELALSHVDMMFQFHCVKGFPVSLDATCRGLGLPSKTDGVSGEMAPILWQRGEYETVLQYVAQDVNCTLAVALAVEQRRELRWITQKGRLNGIPIPCLLTVREALSLPLPNTDWMDSPIPRSRFVGWMEAKKEPG